MTSHARTIPEHDSRDVEPRATSSTMPSAPSPSRPDQGGEVGEEWELHLVPPLDPGFPYDDKIERLGERFGAAGPFVVVVLLRQAHTQARRGGRVEWSTRALAAEAYLDDPNVAVNIIQAAAEVNLVKLDRLDDRAFALRFVRWKKHRQRWRRLQERLGLFDPNGTERLEQHGAAQTLSPDPSPLQLPGVSSFAVEETNNTPKKGFVGPPAPEQVLVALAAVADAKPSAKPLKDHLVAKACVDFADRNLEHEADRFEHWWIDGTGENRNLRDVCGAWRNWLRQSPRAARAAGPRSSRLSADLDRLDQLQRDVT